MEIRLRRGRTGYPGPGAPGNRIGEKDNGKERRTRTLRAGQGEGEGRTRKEMVGAAGFEPTPSSPPDWCATRLRYAPMGFGPDSVSSGVAETKCRLSSRRWDRRKAGYKGPFGIPVRSCGRGVLKERRWSRGGRTSDLPNAIAALSKLSYASGIG